MDGKLKVLHITTAFAHSKAPHITPWLTQLLIALRKLGVDARVLTSSHRGLGDGEYEGIPTYRFRYSPSSVENLTHDVAIYERLRLQKWRYLQLPPFMLSGLIKAFSVERIFKPDIVHVHWPIPNALWALPFKGKKILTFHSTELSLMAKLGNLGKMFLPFLRNADFYTFNSTFTRGRFREIVGEMKVESKVIPMPVGWIPHIKDIRKEKGRVLFVGRAVYWKGGDVLIRAAHVLKQKGIDLKLVFVGDGPAKEEWRKLSEKLKVKAEFKGWMSGDDLSKEYSKAWILVLPSRSDPKVWTESLGMVLVEAMLHGTPVIATRLGGPLDIIDDGDNGFFFEMGDFEDLAYKLKIILENEDLARKMGEKGKRKAERYLPFSVAKEYLDVYLSLLSSPQKL